MTIEELEKRVQAMEDIEAIKRMHRDYVFCLINHQWTDMVDCFTEDATMNIAENKPCKGKEEISHLLVDVIAERVPWDEGHFVSQPVITVDGDKAKGHWILYVLFFEPSMGWRQARYDCEYRKVNGEWKFSSLVFKAPWPAPPQSKN
jgi:hypothetical protein